MKKLGIKLYVVLVMLMSLGFLLYQKGSFDGILKTISFVRYGEAKLCEDDTKKVADDLSGKGIGDDSFESQKVTEEPGSITYEIKNNVKEKSYYYEYKNDKLAWWFKRDAEHRPSGCDDTIDISKYEGYYRDRAKDNSSEKVLYLTFDCGYENGYTEKILNVLKKQNVPACFFVTKTYIRDNLNLVERMKGEGHQVGNHTITHPSMPGKSYEEIIKEVTGCADYMREATGYSMDPYLRPPMGEYSERTLAITRDLGYKTIFWSMAYLDYDVNKQPGANYVIEHFNKYHHNGAIILMHNVSSSNAAALETVIKNMREQGYRFASLNELK